MINFQDSFVNIVLRVDFVKNYEFFFFQNYDEIVSIKKLTKNWYKFEHFLVLFTKVRHCSHALNILASKGMELLVTETCYKRALNTKCWIPNPHHARAFFLNTNLCITRNHLFIIFINQFYRGFSTVLTNLAIYNNNNILE